ncbi:MAG: hypothetical protein AAF735_06040 [Myxococcota bacterium]
MKRASRVLRVLTTLSFAVAFPVSAQDSEESEVVEEEESEVDLDEEAEVEDLELQEIDPEIFEDALEDYYDRSFVSSAAGFWSYIYYGDPSAENYEWAQFFLAESLRELGLYHGAVQYYYLVSKTRSQPEILPEALDRLEIISRERPFSEALVYEDLLYDSEFGFLPKRLFDWVNYVQGLYNYRNGFIDWAVRSFEQIPDTSVYYPRAQYVRAVYALKRGRDGEALAFFETIVESETASARAKNRAYLSMARLLFDNREFDQALKLYDQVEQIDLSFEQAELLLEKAWTAYNLKQYRKAMGLLHALKAPSYTRYFLPDAYVLRGLILKRLCHYIPAKRVVREFRFDHGRALTLLRRRQPLNRIKTIVEGGTQTGEISRRTAFLRTLEDERRRIERYDSSWEDVELDQHLRRLYDLEIREQARLWNLDFDTSADDTALELLEVEEQMNLLDYEIGLDIFKRLKLEEAKQTKEEPLIVPYDSDSVYYEFDTEFWNDELHSYEFFINNRCFEAAG